MITLFKYDWSGNIEEVIQVPNDEIAKNWPGYSRAGRPIDIHNEWFDMIAQEIRPREPWEPVINKTDINADGNDDLIISGLPVGTQVFWDGVQYVVNDGEFILTTVDWGVGHIRIVPPGKQIRTVVFNAIES